MQKGDGDDLGDGHLGDGDLGDGLGKDSRGDGEEKDSPHRDERYGESLETKCSCSQLCIQQCMHYLL